MFKKIIGLFSKKEDDQPKQTISDKVQELTLEGEDPSSLYYPYYLELLINRSSFIKEEMKPVVASMFGLDKGRIILDEDNLTLDEKKQYKLNTRMKINRKVYSVLTDEGINAYRNPKYVLEKLWINAKSLSSLKASLERMRAFGVERVILNIPNSGLECDWCKAQEGKEVSVNEDLDMLLLNNCSSGDCKMMLALRPVLTF